MKGVKKKVKHSRGLLFAGYRVGCGHICVRSPWRNGKIASWSSWLYKPRVHGGAQRVDREAGDQFGWPRDPAPALSKDPAGWEGKCGVAVRLVGRLAPWLPFASVVKSVKSPSAFPK